MELLKNWIAAERGRGVRLAAWLHVPPSFVAKMASGDKPIPVEHATAIECFTDGVVSRKAIRPHDWPRIWPELASPPESHPPAPRAEAQEVANG